MDLHVVGGCWIAEQRWIVYEGWQCSSDVAVYGLSDLPSSL